VAFGYYRSVRRESWFSALRTDHLYPLLALSTLGFLAGALPVFPNDFWWHLRTGQIIAEEGRIPTTQLFSWTLPPEAPFIYTSWLGELMFYGIYQLGGLELISFTRNVLAMATFALLGIEAHRRSGSWRLAGLAVVLATLMSLTNFLVRPQDFSWVPFAAMILLLGRYADGQLRPAWLWALPAIMVFWVNAHGAFMLGLVVPYCFAAGETARTLLRQERALSWRQVRWLYLACLGTVLATLVTPQGLQSYTGVVVLVLEDRASQEFGIEWQPTTPSGLSYVTFFASILLFLVTFAYARRRPTPTDLLLLCAFLWLAWTGKRYVMWYSLVAMPILAQGLASVRPTHPGRRSTRQAPLFTWLLAGLMAVPVVLGQPWFIRVLPLGEEYDRHVHPPPAPPLLSTRTPLAATEYLRAHPGGRLFSDLGYSSYLIWALPGQPIFVDPRIAPYPYQQWVDYREIIKGRRAAELLARYGANRVLLRLEEQGPLSEALAASVGWRREYADPWSEVWRWEEPSGEFSSLEGRG
jgi:hypothetical protein